MKDIFLRYVFTLLHPFQVHNQLRLDRLGNDVLPFAKEGSRYRGVDYYEAMSVSWLFFVCHCFYSLVAIHLSIYSQRFLEEGEGMMSLVGWGQGVSLIKLIGVATFFPLLTWFWVKFWDMIIKFFAELFDVDESDIERASGEIAHNSLVSHTFLLVPIFGGLVQSIASLVLLYAGLRKNLALARIQALMVIASPLFLFLGLFFLSALVLFNLIF